RDFHVTGVQTCALPIWSYDEHFRVGNRLTDRVGTTVHLRWVQVGRTERLGQTVHEEGFRCGEASTQLLQRGARHPATGVGEVSSSEERRVGKEGRSRCA